MLRIFNKFYNRQTGGSAVGQRTIWIISFPFIVFFLALDSVQFTKTYFDARILVTLIILAYYLILLKVADTRLRKLMLVTPPFFYLGEIFLCNVLDMYDYRENRIPLYVPFGHAIVYGSGYLLTMDAWLQNHKAILKKIFFIAYATLFICAGILFFDILSLILGVLFFLILNRKNWNIMYYYISLYVLLVEFVGVYFGVWVWDSYALNIIPTVNPPVGAVFLYAGGDLLLLRLMRWIDKKQFFKPENANRPNDIW